MDDQPAGPAVPRSEIVDLAAKLAPALAGRAAGYDEADEFAHQDVAELVASGYTSITVPRELGGMGAGALDLVAAQSRLAEGSPATALAVNMHLYWCGVAADLWRQGDRSLEWLLHEAAAGEVFAAGHAEAGNDLPLLLSAARAERVGGGYRLHGRKQFGSLTPVWTRLGVHALDASDPRGPQIVHLFLPRGTEGSRIEATWDTLGMRATRSDDTVLAGALVPDRYVARVLPAGAVDAFVLAVFAWALLGFANVYYAIAQRALDLTVPSARQRTSLGLTRPMAYHPEVQHLVAEMALELEAMGPHVDRIAADWSDGVDHGGRWPMKLVAAKYHCVESAKRVVDLALAVSGGAGMFKANELERLYRDVRCGGFHPANPLLTHEIVGKTALGVDLGEQPRWG
jgi:alkylation response protein AidB-like acyl-CoA dehydrogenase